jgi:hypothetical protein
MANEMTAGAILIELRAQYKELEAGVKKAKEIMGQFGRQTEQTGKQVDAAGNKISASFQKGGNALVQSEARYAKLTARLISMQFAMSALAGGKGGMGDFGKALDSFSKGATAAAAAYAAFQGKLTAGGAAALGAGIAGIDFYAARIRASIEATDASTDATIRSEKALTMLKDAFSDASQGAAVFGASGLDAALAQLGAMQAVFQANLKRLREIPFEISKIRATLDAELGTGWHIGGFDAAFGLLQDSDKKNALRSSLAALNTERDHILRTQGDIAGQAGAAAALAGLQRMREEASALAAAIAQVQDVGARAIETGLSDPAQVASQNLEAARRALQQVLETEIRLKAIVANDFTDPAVLAQAKSQLASLDVSAAQGRFQNAQARDAAVRNLNSLSESFSNSFSSAIERGILSGQKPMEILADTGEALFSNAISEAMKQVQTGLAAAFKAAAGGSDLIGGALTGLFGIGGAFLSRGLGNRSTESFTGVRSIVESSQAMRGIVAGPANVSIAEVGEDISRSMAPVIAVLERSYFVQTRIERNTRPGGRAGAGGESIVGVPTA